MEPFIDAGLRPVYLAGSALGVILAMEGLTWAAWQLTVSHAGFLAARGWRAPLFSPLGAVQRILAMPAFISQLGRGRIGLTFAHAGNGFLNSPIVPLATPLPHIYMNFAGVGLGARVWLALLGCVMLSRILGADRFLNAYADKCAVRLYRGVSEWDQRAPILFLRSSEAGARALPALTRYPLLKFSAGVARARTLDQVLLDCASPYGPVVAASPQFGPAPRWNAAPVSSTDDVPPGRETIVSLARGAKAVVVCLDGGESARSTVDLIAGAGARERTIILAGLSLPADAAKTVFAALVPAGEAPEIRRGQRPVAAFLDASGRWRVLTASLEPCVQTCTIGLNMALMEKFGPARPRLTITVEYRVVERAKSQKQPAASLPRLADQFVGGSGQ